MASTQDSDAQVPTFAQGQTHVQTGAPSQAQSGGARIEARDVNLWYDDFHALKDVTFTMPARSATALIGPSGCGKSTFLRCLNRMNDRIKGCRHEGTITVGGIDIDRDMDEYELRTRVGMVFQQPNPFPLTIYDNVAYGPRRHGHPKRAELNEIVEQALVRVGLFNEVKDNLKASGLALSGGQQQRLCIARTLAVNPDVLLMDEPTSALDPISTALVEQLMVDLAGDHTVIVVTHNMQQAQRVANQTAFFYLGELVEVGPTDQIFTAPREKRTQDYLTGKFS